MRPWGKRILLFLIVVLIGIQFVPVHRSNPAADPAKTIYSTETVPSNVHAVLDRSCKDCHSNETHWPWYSYVAPVSWLVASDVNDGRHHLNFSEWSTYDDRRKSHKLGEICDELRSGEMPDTKYTLIHRDAKLTQEERNSLCAWAESIRKQGDTAEKQPAGHDEHGTPAH